MSDRLLSLALPATITFERHRCGERLPAALLLPGSGPTDRDGNQPPLLTPNTLRDLAAALDRDRVVTLLFDKCGTGRTGLGAFARRPQDLDYPAFVRQAVAARDHLRRRAEVAPNRVALAGHSEGAVTALVLAAHAPPRQRAAAHAAAPGVFIDRAIDVAVPDLRGGRAVDTTTMPAPLAALFQLLVGPNRRFVTTDDAVFPPDVARRLPPMPVLLTCGELDPQVPCHMTDQLASVVGHRVVLPAVGHAMVTADGTLSLVLTRELGALRW
ncbi:alpha/beta hydrolase family protein [Lentzea sp. NPDC092896]|uniref:alpha/beta hydrolase family protein n=1 Tax=Lentzea sp. NPDC092896 TaxID=3364127 RepID=UPI003822FAAD